MPRGLKRCRICLAWQNVQLDANKVCSDCRSAPDGHANKPQTYRIVCVSCGRGPEVKWTSAQLRAFALGIDPTQPKHCEFCQGFLSPEPTRSLTA